MNSSITSYVCLGSLCLMPLIMFAVGVAVGRGAIPWIIRIEPRNKQQDDEEYVTEVIDDGTGY